MAKIMKTSVQEEALKKINSNLKNVSVINMILEKEGEKGLSVTYGKSRFALPVSTDFTTDILNDVRKTLVVETKNLSKKHSIMLDDSDFEILDGKKELEPEKEEEPEEVKQVETDEVETESTGSEWQEDNNNAVNAWEGFGDDYDERD